ncbi:ABC transporter permease [Brevibacillus marinus]|uniref:ABC transporter permease n=1 Tax=Brevibacillus marinus TaxID=2496837 RepID=UPI000F8459D3|nr:iron ABC transporter permease [Brevibacillus marinus]
MMLARLRRSIHRHTNGWVILSILTAAIVLLPLLAIAVSIFSAPNENWSHIRQYLLRDYVLQSVWLVLFTGAATAALGALLAWLIAAYDFPWKSLFRWALMLPLAVPPYIAAFTYGYMLSYTGVVQTTLRSWGWAANQAWFDIMSLPGAVFIFTMFLYPYVYLITRAFLERQSGSYIENARLLGRSSWSIFFRVVLPLSRPALVSGVTLVAFEVLSDYGVVNYYGIQTFTTAIFKTWFGMYDIDSATRLAAWFLLCIVSLILLERFLRRRRRFSATTGRLSPLAPQRLRGVTAALATLFCLAVLAVSFLVPVGQLLVWASWTFDDVAVTADFRLLTYNTVTVAVIATVLIMIFSVIVANTGRTLNNAFGIALAKAMTTGYSIPGAIIAIGVMSLFITLDELLLPLYRSLGWGEAPLVLSLSLVMLIVAYVIRFMATGYNAVESGFEKIGMKYTESSRLLGFGMTRTFFRVDLPLIRGSLLSGVILTFVEIVKELPLAMLLRPFNFDTLATKAYQYASDERIFSAAVPSLAIICVALASILLFHHLGKRVRS